VSGGKTKFKRTWGDIALADNWRLEGKKASKLKRVRKVKKKKRRMIFMLIHNLIHKPISLKYQQTKK